MAGPLKWIIELYDKVSGPAERMSKSAEKFEHSMKKAGDSTEKMAKAQKDLSASNIAVMTEGVHLAVEAVDKLIEKFIEFGQETLRAADFERTTNIIFGSLAGSAEAGAQMFEKAQDYASKAGISIKDSVDIFRTLSTGGIKDAGENLFILAQAAGDVALKTGASGASIAQTFADITSKGELTGLQLRAFVGAIPMDQLAKRLGVASGSFHDLQQQLNQSPVSAQRGIQAILDTLQNVEGGTLGTIRKSVGEGFEGMSTRISNAWEKALGSFSKTEAFQRVLSDMEKIAKVLEDPAFQSAVDHFATKMVDVADALPKIGRGIVGVGKFLNGFSSEGWISKGAKALGDFIVGPAVPPEKFEKAGASSAQHMISGFSGPGGIEAHSPSKVFERLGNYSVEGFNIGYESGRDDGVGVPTTTTRAPQSGSPSASHKIELHQEFIIHADHGMDLQELAHRIAELSASSLQSPLESLALSMGTI